MSARLSLRAKILLLVACSLTASFGTYIYVGTGLLVSDKSSYIYDFHHTQLRSYTQQIDDKLSATVSDLKTLASIPSDAIPAFLQSKSSLPQSLTLFRAIDPDHFDSGKVWGASSQELSKIWQAQNWHPRDFEKSGSLAGGLTDGNELPLAVLGRSPDGASVVAFALVKLQFAAADEAGSNTGHYTHFITSQGKTAFASSAMREIENSPEVQNFELSIRSSPFGSGARDLVVGKAGYLVSYEKLQSAPIIGVMFTPRAIAFKSSEQLFLRSLVLGIGILLLAFGSSIALVRGITRRLIHIWSATQKVASGDFSVRVPEQVRGDEVADLALSFNKMANRIHELMVETAQKARMEKELETAQVVQQRFLPECGLSTASLQISGKSLAATECAGDWWQYQQIGKFIIVAIGDVTGHGVSSALVTASAHGAFSIVAREFKRKAEAHAITDTAPVMLEFMRHLNTAVDAAACGRSTMTALLAIIDTETGDMQITNASHRPPYVLKAKRRSSADALKAFDVVLAPECPALGQSPSYEIQIKHYQLEPGDVVFWYTDGLIECENEAQKRMSKTMLIQMLATACQAPQSKADEICASVLGRFSEFLGVRASNPEDDITLVIGVIPETARFVPVSTETLKMEAA